MFAPPADIVRAKAAISKTRDKDGKKSSFKNKSGKRIGKRKMVGIGEGPAEDSLDTDAALDMVAGMRGTADVENPLGHAISPSRKPSLDDDDIAQLARVEAMFQAEQQAKKNAQTNGTGNPDISDSNVVMNAALNKRDYVRLAHELLDEDGRATLLPNVMEGDEYGRVVGEHKDENGDTIHRITGHYSKKSDWYHREDLVKILDPAVPRSQVSEHEVEETFDDLEDANALPSLCTIGSVVVGLPQQRWLPPRRLPLRR